MEKVTSDSILLKKYEKQFEDGLDVKGLFKLRTKLYRLSNFRLSTDEWVLKHQLLECIREFIAEE